MAANPPCFSLRKAWKFIWKFRWTCQSMRAHPRYTFLGKENKSGIGIDHRNKKCKEVATEEFLKGRLVLLLEIERPHSKSHVFSKQSVFYFIKLSALFFSPLMLYFVFNPSLLFLPACLGRFLYVMSSFFDCFLAAAWWAVLHLLYYSYFDGIDASVILCQNWW